MLPIGRRTECKDHSDVDADAHHLKTQQKRSTMGSSTHEPYIVVRLSNIYILVIYCMQGLSFGSGAAPLLSAPWWSVGFLGCVLCRILVVQFFAPCYFHVVIAARIIMCPELVHSVKHFVHCWFLLLIFTISYLLIF